MNTWVVHQPGPMESEPLRRVEREATPIPGWKRYEWAKDVLPEGDSARGEEK